MKKIVLFVFVASSILYASYVAAKHFWRGETMSISKVCERWGDHDFDAAKFKIGKESDRAAMSCSILKNQKQFTGKSVQEIKQILGDYNGFYFIDTFPAYIISGTEDPEDTWQLVFNLGTKRKVTEIFMHKNCCDKSATDKHVAQ